jgi:hypothetical protein
MKPGLTLFVFCIGLSSPLHAEQHCDSASIEASSPTTRFTDNGDGTVTDQVSQLMWMRCSVGQTWSAGSCGGEPERLDWTAGADAAARVNASGTQFFNDWRMPQLSELATIIERQCRDPRINLEVFPTTPGAFFWTQSMRPAEGFDELAYALSFGPDGVEHRPKSEPHHLRLVRTAP